jgi:hypothetical protein
MGPCPSMFMWCLTIPVFPKSPVEDANIACLSFKNLVILIQSNSGISTGRLLSKLKTLDDSSRSAQEFTWKKTLLGEDDNYTVQGEKINGVLTLVFKTLPRCELLLRWATSPNSKVNISEKCKMSFAHTGCVNLHNIKCTKTDCARMMRTKKYFLTEEAESMCYIIIFFFFFEMLKSCL